MRSARRDAARFRFVCEEDDASSERQDADRPKEADRPKSRISAFAEKMKARKRARTKERAGKQFAQQFEASGADAACESRAALYKGEMGAAHKRSFRMQRDGRTESRMSSFGNAVAKMLSSRRAITVIGAVGCLALTCAFLYTPAQQYYHAIREHDRAVAELAAVQERNDELANAVDYLETDEGIEAQARDDLGWVGEGEVSVYVQGSGGSSGSDSSASGTVGNIQPGSIEAPETWYSPILDVIFGEG